MIFATRKNGTLDGELLLVHPDRKRAVVVGSVAPTMLYALEHWQKCEAELKKIDKDLRSQNHKEIFELDHKNLMSSLPRTWLFADGSAYVHHIKLVRKARHAALPETLMTVPLMYQAEGGRFLAPTENIPQVDFSHGTDFEAEVGVIVDQCPIGVSAQEALKKVRLLVLINDVSLRGLIPAELAQGFGFFVSKPNKALSPFALTPDEMGSNWREGKIHRPLHVDLNGQKFGRARAEEMQFHFGELIAHAAKTRELAAGSLIGSGTVANEDPTVGSSCLAEKRTIEQIEKGQPITPFMKPGDEVKIWMENESGQSLFGEIKQKVVQI